MRWRTKIRRGFTLIELLVVLVILALLAGIVLPKFLAQGEKAKVSTATTQIEQFKSAAQLFMVDNGSAPKSLDELIHQPSNAKNWKKYLSDLNEIPKDPWQNDYQYQTPATNGDDFEIKSFGPDGKEGGGDDISSIKGGEQK